MTARRTTLGQQAAIRENGQVDIDACQDIVSFVLTLARAGYPVEMIARVVTLACGLIPKTLRTPGRPSADGLQDPYHVLTLWHSKTAYLLNGRPRPLRLRGAEPSIEALMREVNPKLDLHTAMGLLQQARTLRRIGNRYLPRADIVVHRGRRLYSAHHRRVLNSVLGTLDHNSNPNARWAGWYDFVAECPHYPENRVPALQNYLRKQADAFLRSIDNYMNREELNRRPGVRTRRVSIGVFEHQNPSRERSPELQGTLRDVLKQLPAKRSDFAPGARGGRRAAIR